MVFNRMIALVPISHFQQGVSAAKRACAKRYSEQFNIAMDEAVKIIAKATVKRLKNYSDDFLRYELTIKE
jgi:hypothetical protein